MSVIKLEVDPRCVKCGNEWPALRYLSHHHPENFTDGKVLEVTCTRCGFLWLRLPMDAVDPALDVSSVTSPHTVLIDHGPNQPSTVVEMTATVTPKTGPDWLEDLKKRYPEGIPPEVHLPGSDF